MNMFVSQFLDEAAVYLGPQDIVPNGVVEFSLPDVFPWALWSSNNFGYFQVYSGQQNNNYTLLISEPSPYLYGQMGYLEFGFCNANLGTNFQVQFASNVPTSASNVATIKFFKKRPDCGPIATVTNAPAISQITGTSSAAAYTTSFNSPPALAQGYVVQIALESVSATGGSMASWQVQTVQGLPNRNVYAGLNTNYIVDVSTGTDFTTDVVNFTLVNLWGYPNRWFTNSTASLPNSISNPVAVFPVTDLSGAIYSGRVMKFISTPTFPNNNMLVIFQVTPGIGVTSFTVDFFLYFWYIF